MDLHQTRVLSAEAVGDGLTLLTLATGTWSATHERPGQYVMFQGPGDDRARPLALASAPGGEAVALLLKGDGDRAASLRGLKTGDTVRCSAPAGPGYPIEKVAGQTLWLFATGTALAPIKTAVDVLLQRPIAERPASWRLLIGARRPSELAFQDDLDRYREAGMDVAVAFSRPAEGPGARVQALLTDPPVDPQRTYAFVCGQPEMMAEVEARLQAMGVAADRCFRNF